jgi:hypothetical protein
LSIAPPPLLIGEWLTVLAKELAQESKLLVLYTKIYVPELIEVYLAYRLPF